MKKPARSRMFGFAGAVVIVAALVVACPTATKETEKATSYTITVNQGGGSGSTADRKTATAGETVTLTAGSHTGHGFDGWQVVKPTGGLTITGNKFQMPAGDVEVTAKWKADGNGNGNGNGNTDTHVHDWGDWIVTLPATILAVGKEKHVCKDDASHFEERDIEKLASLLETVEVAGGKFMYGRDGDENTGTLVEVEKSFHISKNLVTQGQWKAVMGEDKNPSWFDGENAQDMNDGNKEIPATPKFNRDNLPVESVSWYDVLVFANKLSMKEGVKPAYSIKGETDPAKWGDVPTSSNADWNTVKIDEDANGWRLPTRQQWEFAAKGGTKTSGYKGDTTDTYFRYSGSDTASDVAWYDENSDGRTHEVGKKNANELGLYDMSGNVSEWCFDWYVQSIGLRVIRVGSWNSSADSISYRSTNGNYPYHRAENIGFRLVRP